MLVFGLLTMEEKNSMFKTKVTGYVVVMLILFQSFTAVASSLDFHTLDVEHLAEVHEHDKHDAHASIVAPVVKTSSIKIMCASLILCFQRAFRPNAPCTFLNRALRFFPPCDLVFLFRTSKSADQFNLFSFAINCAKRAD